MSQTPDQRRSTPSSAHRRDLWRPEEEDVDDPNTCDRLLEPTTRTRVSKATAATAASADRTSRRGTTHGIVAAVLVALGGLVIGALIL
ncbi:MAG: hypothetical protein KTR31_37430 [Myxococcales bacterium]|nr:hypothetical protein [Myxococcales bacterium]